MKDKIEINDANYEDVMAGLLEQHFSEEEKEEILYDIARDPFLQFEWKQFQKCLVKEDIQPYEIEEIEFWKSLQQKDEVKPVAGKRMVVTWFRLRIAASVILLAGLLYYLLLPGIKSNNTPVMVKANIEMKQDEPPVGIEAEPKAALPSPTAVALKQKAASRSIKTIHEVEKAEVPLTETIVQIAIHEPVTETVLVPEPKAVSRYTVHISSEGISENDFALLDDYDIQKVSEEDLNRINNTLKKQQTTLAQLLKNTKVQLKQKDHKIYLMASGDHQSTYILEIAN